MQGDKVFDEKDKGWISVEDALKEFLAAVPDVLKEFGIDVETKTKESMG